MSIKQYLKIKIKMKWNIVRYNVLKPFSRFKRVEAYQDELVRKFVRLVIEMQHLELNNYHHCRLDAIKRRRERKS